MAGLGRRTYLRDVNPYLICPLCRGYLIDATTVVECLHSFCKSCILKHLRNEAHCPTCSHPLNKAKPNIKADKALQDIVYKLVPGLYHKEMRKRREFYKKHPEHADSATLEQRGDDVSGRLIFAPEDAVSLSLEFLPPGADPLTILLSTNDTDSVQQHLNNNNTNGNTNRRYLQCPALVTIAHLKKFLALKYSVDLTRYTIEVCHRRAPLPEHWTLMDVAYIYAWKRNAPMRFFYRIAQEEPRLEAPPYDRPSTPGLGASLPPGDSNVLATDDIKTGKDAQISLQQIKVQQIKSPIKILKNSDGCYEVMKSPLTNDPSNPVPITTNEKASDTEFSVISIGDGQNSNGVKITLKQCSPTSANSKKPKIISNVLLRRSPSEKSLVKSPPVPTNTEQIQPTETNTVRLLTIEHLPKDPEKDGDSRDKHEKQKRKVTFLDVPKSAKSNADNISKKLAEHPDKRQFLQSFELTAKESRIEGDASSVCQNANKIDVYTFPGDPLPLPPTVPAGAVKRKCPPGLPIFEQKKRKTPFSSQPKKLTVKPLNRVKTIQQLSPNSNDVSSTSGNFSANTVTMSSTSTGSATTTNAKSSTSLNNTRNLLGGCGLNIPASLSITLTAPKPSTNSTVIDPGHSKDNQNLLNKVNPSITLNDRSVDPRVLKALKTGQIRMPAALKLKMKSVDRDSKVSPKRKKEHDGTGEDVLDLSGGKKMDIHPLRIPQPVSKPKGKNVPASTRENITGQSQVITLVGGQRYYRAPPGSLTPAAHRVTDCPLPTSARPPVYAPSCLPSPTSNRSSSLCSVFPSLQSLYAKSHLAAQCAPIKPARSTVASLSVPIIKQANSVTLPCENALR